MSRPLSSRGAVLLVTLLAVAVTLVSLVAVAPRTPALQTPALQTPALQTAAVDTSRFDPGNIISDEIFFDGRAYAPDVQAFLASKAPSCRAAADGTPCLKDYRQDTPTLAGTPFCGAYPGARGESAADIITKVSWACSINPRVLLVLLQKEQGLVTASGSGLTPTRYQKATGFGCPDTAPCDPQFSGFFYQVYNAARGFQNYRVNARNFRYRAGITNQVQYHPDLACGSTPVFIANQATAGLYNYTPYVPNAAALRAGAGSGDGCSSYGNRNFWLYYTDWFGSTQLPGGAEVANKYAQLGGANGILGAATSLIGCGLKDGGCYQDYANGSIHWSPATGAHAVWGAVSARWIALGREQGPTGYPTSDELPARGGVYQTFQVGSVYWSGSTGARLVWGAVLDRWSALGREQSVLGFPTGEEAAAANGGVVQAFSGGMVFFSPATGAHEVHGQVLAKWAALGREGGFLGYPVSDEIGTAAGAYSMFAGGDVYFTPSAGAQAVWGNISARWRALGAGNASVGFPLTDEQPAGDGVGAFSPFSNGVIYWSEATGAHELTGVLAEKWKALGGVRSVLGYPTQGVRGVPGGGQVATFQNGSVYRTPGGAAFQVWGAIAGLWNGMGGVGSPLGYPTSDEQRAPDGGIFQTYDGGLAYWSPATGATEVHGLIRDRWAAMGGFAFPGAPVTSELVMPDGVGRANVFSSGAAVYFSPASGTGAVFGAIRAAYASLGHENGVLGYPTSAELPVAGWRGRLTTFTGGHVYWSETTGAHEVHGLILGRYLELGGPDSALGLPTSHEYGVPGGRRSDFEKGSITFTTSTGALTVTTR